MSISTIYTYLRIRSLHLSVYGRQAHHHNLNVKILLKDILNIKIETFSYTEMDLQHYDFKKKL